MLLQWDGKIYWGADCVNRLALLSTGSDLFNQINAAIFRKPCLSKALYPFMRAGRNLGLTLMGGQDAVLIPAWRARFPLDARQPFTPPTQPTLQYDFRQKTAAR